MLTAVAAVIAALVGSGGVTALFSVRSKNRALDGGTLAAVMAKATEVYEGLTGELRVEVDRVIAREKECREELATLRREVAGLRGEVTSVKARIDDSGAV